MLPETRPERPILYARPNRGAETSRFSTGVTRAAPVSVQRSTSRAGPSAGRMMPKPPGDGMYLPARGHRTRSDFRDTARKAVLLASEIRSRILAETGTKSQYKSDISSALCLASFVAG